ncbi:MAG: biopolymer transporter ExbD [Candidatus Marinimicrobia bacterium]|jgi:biopolymer transport protein ExbD|nr:biopolymer transporter ExbD [Candidatus Neomarinimicrobiota bacterium]
MAVLKNKNNGADEEVEIPTTALPDIVFLLLIFFLVTTTIDMDKGLSLVLPAQGEQTEVNKKNISNLLVNATGQILLDEEPVPLSDLQARIEQKIAQNDNLIISVQTASQTKYSRYIDVLDEVKQAGASRISIANPQE